MAYRTVVVHDPYSWEGMLTIKERIKEQQPRELAKSILRRPSSSTAAEHLPQRIVLRAIPVTSPTSAATASITKTEFSTGLPTPAFSYCEHINSYAEFAEPGSTLLQALQDYDSLQKLQQHPNSTELPLDAYDSTSLPLTSSASAADGEMPPFDYSDTHYHLQEAERGWMGEDHLEEEHPLVFEGHEAEYPGRYYFCSDAAAAAVVTADSPPYNLSTKGYPVEPNRW